MLRLHKRKLKKLQPPALNYLFTELYGAASAAGERTLRAADGSVITDKNQVGFETFKNRYIVGTPEFAIEQLSMYKAVSPSVICWMHLPGISGKESMKSVELLQKCNAGIPKII